MCRVGKIFFIVDQINAIAFQDKLWQLKFTSLYFALFRATIHAMQLEAYTDRRTSFDVLTKNSVMAERSPQIEVLALKRVKIIGR